MIKLWVSPLSKEIIESIAEFCNKKKKNAIGFIISKNQVSNSGYTGFDNQSLIDIVKNKFIIPPPISRDHSDCSRIDLDIDCKYLNGIHIDPFFAGNDPVKTTVETILYCESLNNNLFYEIGTEEARFIYNYYYLDDFLKYLKLQLPPNIFNKILYVVIQCGTALKNGKNKSEIDYSNLKSMYEVCLKYNKYPKQHNSDYLSNKILKKESDLCDRKLSINIAPEIGTIQSLAIYDYINEKLKQKYYNLVLNNKNTYKWFDKDYDYNANKRIVIASCGHYVYNENEFSEIMAYASKDIIKIHLLEYLEEKYISLS